MERRPRFSRGIRFARFYGVFLTRPSNVVQEVHVMRQVLALFVAVVFTLSLGGIALAQGTQTTPGSTPPAATPDPSKSSTDPAKPAAPGSSSSTSTPSGSTGKSGMDKSAAGKDKAGYRPAAAARGSHKMMGEVTRIDAAKGMVTLKTDEGDMDLHFPPAALQGIKEGDRVEVQLAIRPAAAAGTSMKSGSDAKAPAAGAPAKPKTP
jgi:Cu/Ag efflux protein CusF